MGNIVKQMLHAGAVGDLEEQIEKAGEQGNDTILMNEELARLTNFTVDDESEEYKKLYEDWEALYFFLMITGILIVTFMTKRKNKCPSCLCGYFALAVPVNFFELKSRRKPFLAAFALVTMTLVDGVISGTSFLPEEIKIPVYFKVIVKMLIASVIGCQFYPLFAFIYMATLPSCIIGLIYHLLYMTLAILLEIPAGNLTTKALVKELLLRGIVFFIAGTYIFYWYIKQIFRFCSGRKKKIDNDSGKHEIKYVKHLLMREERDLTKVMVLTESRTNKCLEWFQKNVYRREVGFRYSLFVLASCLIGFLIITHISIVTFYGMIKNAIDVLYLLEYIHRWKKETMFNFVAWAVQKFTSGGPTKAAETETKTLITLYDFIYAQSLIIVGGSIAGGFAAYILSLVNLCHLLSSHRENILNLLKRKKHQNIISQDFSNISLVKSAIQYGGYQVAYLIAGFTIQLFVLNVTLILLGEIIVLPIQFAFWSTVLKICEFVGPIIVTLIFIQLTQYLMIRFFFLEDQGKTLALDNRRGFFIMSYFVFFFNIFTGIFSCVKRILIGSIIGILFVPRLDKSIYPRLFEKKDSGFKAYSCLLHFEALQSNPIVITFVTLLTIRNNSRFNGSYSPEQEILLRSKISRKKQVARTRWYVAYTLIRNPSIIEFRGIHSVLSVREILKRPVENNRETNV